MKKITAAMLILLLLAGCAAPVAESPAPTAEPTPSPTEAVTPTPAPMPSPTAKPTPAPTPTPRVAVFPAPEPTTEVIRPLTGEEIDRVNAAFAQGMKASGLWRNWSYYVRHNQYEAPDGFACAGGTALGHTMVLKSGVDPDTGHYRQISLRWTEEDGWYIDSVTDRAAGLPELTEGELTKEDIARINAIFGWGGGRYGENYDIAAAQLFANHYADITEMDLGDALYYYPDDGCVAFVDTAERDALRGHVENLGEIMYIVPCHRILRSSVDETLRRFAGVTAAELKTMADALYVPEYDAFYNFSSDFGPGHFTCEGGRVEGDTATLWGKSGSSISFQASGEGVRDVVTLKREDGAWHIKSHVKESVDPDASLEAFLLALTGEDIAEISGGEALEKEAVAELIYAGCQNMPWNMDYRWAEIPPEVLKTLALTLRSGEKVTLEALADGKTVRVMGPELPHAPAYLCDQELYEMVKESPQPMAAPAPSPTAKPTPSGVGWDGAAGGAVAGEKGEGERMVQVVF